MISRVEPGSDRVSKPVPTRLLSVNNYYYRRGGAETVFFQHNDLFAEQGYTVRPFSMQHPMNEVSQWSGDFVREIEYGASQSLIGKVRSGVRSIYSFEAKTNINRVIDAFSPDICHAHNIYHHLSTSILRALKKQSVPTVLTLHDLKLACPAYTMLRNGSTCERCKHGVHNVLLNRCMKGSYSLSALVLLEAYVTRVLDSYARCVDRFVVPSQFLIDKFSEWGISTDRFVHIPNFVEGAKQAASDERENQYVYVGRLAPEKGLELLLDVFIENGLRLVVAGDGPLRSLLEAQSAECDNIRWLGRVEKTAVLDLLARSKALIVPSQCYENCPMSVLEAFAQGTPVIAADIGGLTEMVAHQRNGLRFTPGSTSALAVAVEQFDRLSRVDWRDYSHAARGAAVSRYSKSAYYQRISRVYEALLG